MEFEKSDCFSTHTITSDVVMVDKDTGRVVATFYTNEDIDHVMLERNRVIDECIKAINSCELVAPEVMRIRIYEALGALVSLKDKET